MGIPFIDLKAQQAVMRSEIEQRIMGVLDHGQYINGTDLREFESELQEFSGAAHALGLSSGTDALVVPLMAWNVGPGDAVFVPSFTYTASAEAILILRASPVFVDVDPVTFNIDLNDLKAKIAAVKAEGKLTPKVIMSVDLFGLPVEYEDIAAIAKAENMHFLSDSAQGFGGEYKGQKVGGLADVTATSFFPAKPLGCYGDGGAVFTNDEDLAIEMKSIRTHGANPKNKYDVKRVGLNARLDTMQAAILSVKLKHFPSELDARDKLAADYKSALGDAFDCPVVMNHQRSAWAQYTMKVRDGQRDAFIAHMKAKEVPTMVYYPSPMHFQPPYAPYGGGAGSLPVSEQLCHDVVAIPMHPYMDDKDRDTIIEACLAFNN